MYKVVNSNRSGLALLTLLCVLPVVAQTTIDGEKQAATDSSEAGIESIVVTARRFEESLLDVPESINVFSSELIQDADIKQIDDIARLSPGVVVQQGFQGGDRPIVVFRGVGQIGGSAPSVLVLTDGVYAPVGDPLRNQMFDIERIEVIKGPQGSLYGRDSIGGVINVITKRPEDDVSGNLVASYEKESKEKRISGTINLPIAKDVLYFRLAASSLDSDGYFLNLNGSEHDTRSESFVRARALYYPSDFVEIDVRVSHNEFDNGGYNASFFANDDQTYIDDESVGGVLNSVDFDDGYNKRTVNDAAVKVVWDINDDLVLTSISQITDSKIDLLQDADFQLVEGLQIARNSITQDDAWSQEIRLSSAATEEFRWLIGAFYEDAEFAFSFDDEELNIPLGPTTSGSNSVETERMAIFGQVDWQLNDSINSTIALRHDKTERDLNVTRPAVSRGSAETSITSPKVSVSYALANNSSLYVTYGEGFRSGGFDPVTNISFDDETLKSTEIGFKSTFLEGRLFLTSAIYRLDYEDQQVAVVITDEDSGALITTTENLGESETIGFELGLSYSTKNGFDLTAGLDILDSEITQDPDESVVGNTTPFATDYTFNVAVQRSFNISSELELSTRLAYYHQGSQNWDKLNENAQDAYGLLSARISLESRSWFVALSGQNVLDEEFNDQLFSNFAIPGLNVVHPGQPARWNLSVGWRF